ncbi:MAG: hypothetical protein AAB360_00095 [Patescibacteria group bacterium]
MKIFPKVKILLPLIFFAAISVALLFRVVALPGFIIGEDIAFPLTKIQTYKSLQMAFYAWDFNSIVAFRNQTVGFDLSRQLVNNAMSLIGLGGEVHIKLLILTLFALAGYSFFNFLRYLKFGYPVAALMAVFYVTTPVMFNYAIIGWFYAILFLGIAPLAAKYFIEAVANGNNRAVVITSFLIAISFLQPQSLVWLNIILLAFTYYRYKTAGSPGRIIKVLLSVNIIALLLLSPTLLQQIFFSDEGVAGSEYVFATTSRGTTLNFYPLNIIRLWGSLYNMQYETIINNYGLSLLSFLVPLLVLPTLFIKERRRLIVSLWLVALVPLEMYYLSLHREVLLNIPFSNVIRDLARFSVLSVFAFSVLIALAVDHFWLSYRKYRIAIILLFTIWITYLVPWWSGELAAWEHRAGNDSRLTTKIFPPEAYRAEEFMARQEADIKVLYLPYSYSGMVVDDDPKYSRGIRDIFAIYSPIPGLLTATDRHLGPTDFLDMLKKSTVEGNIADALWPTGVRYIVLRKNISNYDLNNDGRRQMWQALEKEVLGGRLEQVFAEGQTVIYRLKNTRPHLYATGDARIINGEIAALQGFGGDINKNTSPAVFLRSQNPRGIDQLVSQIDGKQAPRIEYKKISPVKYRLKISSVRKPFSLVLNESFDEKWKIYKLARQQDSKTDDLLTSLPADLLNSYQILKGNEGEQASRDELKDYIAKDLVTTLGEKGTIKFISRENRGTIQNDNLGGGPFYETYFKPSFETPHLTANGFANAWVIDPAAACQNGGCALNSDGGYEMEIVIEYWLQRVFYLGLAISGITFLSCLGFLIWYYRRDRVRSDGQKVANV